MANDRIFISPSGKDNQTRLTAVEYLAIVDAIHILEQVLCIGEKLGVGFSAGSYASVQQKLAEAFQADIMLKASLEIIKDDTKYAEAEDRIKNKFADLNKAYKDGIL
jgi:hypothetical protein